MPEQPNTQAAALHQAFEASMVAGKAALQAGEMANAYAAFERAHVLGQPRTGQHLRAHLGFLRWAVRQRDLRELFGQLTRIVAALLFTRIWLPTGNTGGARVSAFRPMPVSDELARLLDLPATTTNGRTDPP